MKGVGRKGTSTLSTHSSTHLHCTHQVEALDRDGDRDVDHADYGWNPAIAEHNHHTKGCGAGPGGGGWWLVCQK